jgi:hypothetical protein
MRSLPSPDNSAFPEPQATVQEARKRLEADRTVETRLTPNTVLSPAAIQSRQTGSKPESSTLNSNPFQPQPAAN